MKKIVIKTALITLASVIVLFALAFGIASLAFPGNMSQICENCGNDSLAASYASRQYDYTGSTEDLYRCADLYIRIGDRGNTVKYCKKLVDKQDFKEFCTKKDNNGAASHAQYIYTNYASALYFSKRGEEAIGVANKSVEDGFVIPNAFATLTINAVENNDADFGAKLLAALPEFPQGETQHEAQHVYYNAVKHQLEKLINKS